MAKYGDSAVAWDYSEAAEPFSYGADDAYKLGIDFLDQRGWTIEDWGCGTTWAKHFVTKAAYRGIDFTPSAFVDDVTDLTTYRSRTEAIFMRGLLEHNPDWRGILANAVASFTKRMAVVTFVPFEDADRVIQPAWPTLALSEPDFHALLSDLEVERVDLQTESEFGRESVFLCSKVGH